MYRERGDERSIEIAAPPEAVWRVLMDFSAYPEWNPMVRTIAGTPRVGERLDVEVNNNGSAIRFSPTVLGVDPDREFRWVGRVMVPGLLDGEHYFRLEPTATGTRFTQGERFRWRAGPGGRRVDRCGRGLRRVQPCAPRPGAGYDRRVIPDEFDPLSALTPRARQIAGAARDLLEREGWDAVTMRVLADEIGIRAPSLYKHFANKDAVKSALVAVALAESGAALRPTTGVAELLGRYRAVARANPNLYRLATVGPLDRTSLPEGLEDWSGAPFVEVTGDPHAAQALWAAAHGLAILEIDGRFPTGTAPDATWNDLARRFG
ncbi:putative transcriptional regulator, TetR family [Tsukamurella paurometabola DSM 20162]|uniref:Putative transcriptional regulator, TetR family n=2 Tax=Tsukamurella paurometabola TaxID=2061 RepID=D5US42_TSUPD|nr:putative transcriptional regulator, TetR family [Tsukamurella paurometabola DSM 20162]